MRSATPHFTRMLAIIVGLCLIQAEAGAEGLKQLAFVSPVAPTTVLSGEAAFWSRLNELGWIEGKNIEFRKYFANADRTRLPALMQEALLWRRIGDYVDKVLRGASPAELPIEQPLAFDLVINLSAAKAINLAVPRTILERANRVVQ